ncbi:MAG TPA: O-antigen ligase family protein [Tepidisphaeraceae bacterium]|jgi:hypothetical protein|nr:O-antigen ligase family protein [Tepidisphaeraceae bacterium]
MWFLIFATLFNSAAGQDDIINHIRVGSGGIYIGIMEVIMAGLLLYALAFGGNIARPYPNPKTRASLFIMLTLFCTAIITASIESFLHNVEPGLYLRAVREFAAWPIYAFIGYRLLATPESAYRFMYVIVLAGTLTATMLLLNFGENTEHYEWTQDLNSLRSVQFIGPYAGMAAMVLIYSIASGIKLLPTPVALPLACYCLMGQCAPLHRGEWMGMCFCAVGMFFLLPREKRVATAVKGVVVGILVLLAGLLTINFVTNVMHRDFGKIVQDRFDSMLPTERTNSKEGKAWDTRLDSITAELSIWADNPILGGGFNIQDEMALEGKIENWGAFNHNGWASVLCKSGIVGFIPSMMLLASLLFIGRKLAVSHVHPGTTMMGVFACMCGIYLFSGILAGMVWTMRYGMLIATACGMAYRCLNIQEVLLMQKTAGDQTAEYPEFADSDYQESVMQAF